jgi:hypothetical protein
MNNFNLSARGRSLASLVAATLVAVPALVHGQSYPPAYSATSHYAIGDQVQTGGNV